MKQLIMVICIVLSATFASAANRILYENFDDQSVTLPLFIEQGGPATWAVGRNGSGHSLYFDLDADRDSVLMVLDGRDISISPWPSDEMYVSYWMRYPDATTTNPGGENLKFFYPHFKGGGMVHYSLMNFDDGTSYYSAADNNGNMLTAGKWFRIAAATDGNWHHYEWYIKFSSGVSKFWYDGNLKINYTYGPGKWDNRIYYIAGPSIDASGESYFSRQIDDYDIWDGCPDTSGYSCTSGGGGDIYPPYIDAGSIQPGIDETGVDANADIEFRVVDSLGNLDNLLENHTRFYFTVEPQ